MCLQIQKRILTQLNDLFCINNAIVILQTGQLKLLKLVPAIYYQILIFKQMIALQKL